MPATAAVHSDTLMQLQRHLRARLGPHVGVACTDVEGDPNCLYPEERAYLDRAIPRRQREYAAGRQAARQAMAAIGWPTAAVPSAPDRSPLWPAGLTGSITHTRDVCVAVVACSEDIAAIGIDLESDVAMAPGLWDTICTPEERAWVAAQPAQLQGSWVTRLFCAKEAFYKWQYPQTRRTMEFQDVRMDLDMRTLSIDSRPTFVNHSRAPTCGGNGQLLLSGGQVLAWFIGPCDWAPWTQSSHS